MNQLSQDGQYHYQNKDLGFNLTLPKEFIYYQTQRKTGENFIDLEFFVPTRDPDFIKSDVPSYAKPVTVRIFNNGQIWQAAENETPSEKFKSVGEKDGKIYTLIFWTTVPVDWRQIWNEDYKNNLIENFYLM